MHSFKDFTVPTRCIVHFQQDQDMADRMGSRVIYYQVLIPTDPDMYSPSGGFVRFDPSNSEINGWIPIDDIVVDEVLEEVLEEVVNG